MGNKFCSENKEEIESFNENFDEDISEEIENLCVLIQKQVRSYLIRKKVKFEIQKRKKEESTSHLVFDYKFDPNWDFFFKETNTVFSEERVTVVYYTVIKFYNSFFSCDFEDDQVIISEDSFFCNSDVEFVKEFKAIILFNIANDFSLDKGIAEFIDLSIQMQFCLNTHEKKLELQREIFMKSSNAAIEFLENNQELDKSIDKLQINSSKAKRSLFMDQDAEKELEYETSGDKIMLDKNSFLVESIKSTMDILAKENDKRQMLDKSRDWYYSGNVCRRTKRKHGVGTVYSIKGPVRFKYVGHFFNDEMHGIGIMIDGEGCSYQGEFRKGDKTGFAIEKSETHNYIGMFKEGKYHGYGEFTCLDKKEYYKGCFTKGQENGFGFKKLEDGAQYVGEFKMGQMEGIGVFKWPNGSSFFGNWIQGKMEGKGKFRFKNEDVFVGTYINELKNGKGTYFFSKQNSILRGEWIDGKKEGNFTLTELNRNKVYKLVYSEDQEVD